MKKKKRELSCKFDQNKKDEILKGLKLYIVVR